MKKTKLLLFPFLFSVIFLFVTLYPSARILEDTSSNVHNTKSFNLLKGFDCIPDGDTNYYDHYNDDISQKIGTGTLTDICYGTVLDSDATIKEILEFEDGWFTGYSFYFNDVLFYAATVDPDNETVDVTYDEEVDLPLLYDDPDAKFVKSYITDDYDQNFQELGNSFYDTIALWEFKYTMVGTYKVNDEYQDEDVHIILDYENPKSMDEILSVINASDNMEGLTTWVDHNTYDENNVVLNEVYSFRFIARDSSGNATAQVFYVEAKDINPPVMEQAVQNIEISYSTPLSEEDFEDLFPSHDAVDLDTELIYSFDLRDYEENSDVPGDYEASVSVSDTSGNETESISFTVHVVDDVAPSVAYASVYDTNTETQVSMDEIKSRISAMDAIDGDISDQIVITDDTYTENYNKPGTYSISFCVTDSSMNSSYGTIVIHVYDEEYPVITISKYAVFTKKGTAVTKEQVLELFRTLGYEMTEESLESEAFEMESLNGEYSLTITDDGLPLDNIITTEENIGVSYNIPTETKKKNHFVLILSLSIAGVILISSGVFGFVLYKKKH